MLGFQLPNGRTLFTDSNNVPLVGGTVTYYIPNTTTPKDTYQDEALTIPNTNPVVLDGAGTATMWGSGLYRQVVKDVLGNLISDQEVGLVIDDTSTDTPVTVPSASTVDLGSLVQNVIITGNNNISSFGSSGTPGQTSRIQFTGTLSLVYNATSMLLPNNAQSLPLFPGDMVEAICIATGNWRVFGYSPASTITVLFNPPNNTPYLPYNWCVGNDGNSLYADFGVWGSYSASHFGGKSLVLSAISSGTNIWAWGDNGTTLAPTGWGSTNLTQLQVLIWGLDNTNQRTPSQAVAPGQSAFQGRQAEMHWNMYGGQTQTSRPGAIEFLTGRLNWQVPVANAWIDQNGGLVLQGQAVKSAVTHGTLTYPWASSYDYAPIPNLNWYTYGSDANLTTIASDEADSNLHSIYRWDKIAQGVSATGDLGFRWNYNFSAGQLRLQAIAAGGGGTGVIYFDSNGIVYPQHGVNLSGTVLGNYNEVSGTNLTVSFTTPGNLSVAYTTQAYQYTRIGNRVYLDFQLNFTPTYTTATGDFIINLPLAAGVSGRSVGVVKMVAGFAFPASRTELLLDVATTGTLKVLAQGSSNAATPLSITNFGTGANQQITGSICYSV